MHEVAPHRPSEQIRRDLENALYDKAKIDDQITNAKRLAAATREFGDRDWLRRAEAASKNKGRLLQSLQMELGAAAKYERQQAHKDTGVEFERQFMYQARAVLPRALYEQVLAETMRVHQERGGGNG